MKASTSRPSTLSGPGVERVGGAVFQGEGEPVFCDVADVDFGGAVGTGGLGGDDADGSGAGDQHAAARLDPGALAGPEADGERFDEGGRFVADAVRDVVGEVALDRHVFGEGPVDRRGGIELDVGAQVVPSGFALLALAAGPLRFDGDPLADAGPVNGASDGGDPPGELVAKDQRVVHDVVTDPAVLVVVDVAAADADGGDLDQDLVRVQLRDGQGFHGHVALAFEDGGAHRGRYFGMSGGAGLCG